MEHIRVVGYIYLTIDNYAIEVVANTYQPFNFFFAVVFVIDCIFEPKFGKTSHHAAQICL